MVISLTEAASQLRSFYVYSPGKSCIQTTFSCLVEIMRQVILTSFMDSMVKLKQNMTRKYMIYFRNYLIIYHSVIALIKKYLSLMVDFLPRMVLNLMILGRRIELRSQVMKVLCVNASGLTLMINQEDNQVKEVLELDLDQMLHKDFLMIMILVSIKSFYLNLYRTGCSLPRS